jgi:hypothetical protein
MVKSCCEAIDFGSQYASCNVFTLCRLPVQDIACGDKVAILEIFIDYSDQESYLGRQILIIYKGSIGKDYNLGLSKIKRHIAKPSIYILGLLYKALI